MIPIVYWSYLILSSTFLNGSDPAKAYAYTSYYDIMRNNKVIGYMLCSKVAENETVEYITESSARLSILIDVSVYSKLHSSFSNGQLHDGKLLRIVNGKTKADKKIAWNLDHYLINNEGKAGSFKSKINFSTACLMYVEPAGVKNIFSENFGRYVSIHEISPHKYVLKLPDGDNIYTYYNGKCIEVEVHTSLATVYIKERK